MIKRRYNAYESFSQRRRARRLREGDASLKTNYAVQVRDMNKGYIYLFTGTKTKCKELEDNIDAVLSFIDDTDDEYEAESQLEWLLDQVLPQYGYVGEINYREIDNNDNYYDYETDRYYHIINDVPYDLYM